MDLGLLRGHWTPNLVLSGPASNVALGCFRSLRHMHFSLRSFSRCEHAFPWVEASGGSSAGAVPVAALEVAHRGSRAPSRGDLVRARERLRVADEV